MIETEEYLHKVYAGLLGKCIGVRLGAPVEPTIWTYERIEQCYGEIRGYIKDYKNFAADDDVNGPLFFIRSLIDEPGPLSPQKVGKAWLNYTREGIGFYWWGGYGRSTEHTAYLNLKSGIQAPGSGSIAVNGETIAEQIGGQIFIDSWGWIHPGDVKEAARCTAIAASVGHDRNGIYGGVFIASCISQAFLGGTIETIIETALKEIPEDCEYARVVKAVRDFYTEAPDDWRSARLFLEKNFGYDRYGGVCHIIPNAGVCALSLYYGQADFARTVEIATMSGWDTDCNAGNVGAILGVLKGTEGIPDHYRRPINDWHAASSISGALNNIDLPTASRELAVLGLEKMGRTVPDSIRTGCFSDDIILDFSLPGSSCGLRTSSTYLSPIAPGEEMHRSGAVTILLDRLVRGDSSSIYYKPYYRRSDFDDERYRPSFTPLATEGQTLRIKGFLETMSGSRITLAPYVKDAVSGEIQQDSEIFLQGDQEFSLEWTLPKCPFAIAEAGVLVNSVEAAKFLGKLMITDFSITGKRQFQIDYKDEYKEFDGLSRCSAVGGAWELEDNALHVITQNDFQLYSGAYYTTDSRVKAVLIPDQGFSHLLAFRCRGAEYGYFFGLHEADKVSLIKRNGQNQILEQADFAWSLGNKYELEVTVETHKGKCRIRGFISGEQIIDFTDSDPQPYGMAGLAKWKAGRTHFISLSAEEF